MTPPCGPTVVVIDTELQKEEAGDLALPIYSPPIIASISTDQARSIAKGLVNAENPRIQVGGLRTPDGIANAIELAELTGASVRTAATQRPMSFPQRHPQCGRGSSTAYDYTLGLETDAADVSITGPHIRTLQGRDVTDISFGGVRDPIVPVRGKGPPGANDIVADAEASIPLIVDEVKRLLDESKKSAVEDRIRKHSSTNHAARINELEKALEKKRKGWNGSPVSLARLYADLWPLIMDEDWCLASPTVFSSRHHVQLWDHNKPYSYLGMHGAGGIGYCIGACTGAALAAREQNRFVTNIQCDGDINYAPGSLWTAAHHRLPMLTIMHNNRAWHQEVMYLHFMAGVRGRGTDRSHIGTTLRDPFINYAKMAEAYGMESEGPISDPTKLVAAYERGIAAVKGGRPYLIDVLTQPR
jgi:thiamine pyrophosphate-dependent acetolactate synthase large subunit-like protein